MVLLDMYVNLGDLLLSPQGSQIFFGIAKGTSGFISNSFRDA